jgi:hypothetical protein
MSLTGPSRTIIVQPVEVPHGDPEPVDPAPEPEPAREREPVEEPADRGAVSCGD